MSFSFTFCLVSSVQLHLIKGSSSYQANGKGKSQGGDRRSPVPCTLASFYLEVRVRAKGKGKSQGGDRRSPCTGSSSYLETRQRVKVRVRVGIVVQFHLVNDRRLTWRPGKR